ncbi:hypothetical protein ACRALDRAFT_1031248 [Sodiomyces alcalophilus JCM 7366]|uniref:uncharacterized protein n=1 Tax=Sodiomyces alcalophilus JCM 7366 TaxID=591952 RepID=UPI0039B6B8EE
MYSGENKIMRKLLGKTTPENTTDTSSPGLGITSSPSIPAAYRPNSSQYTVYDAGYPLASVDVSPDRRSAVLASRHVLKTVVFDGLQISDGIDVRAAILAAAGSNKMSTMTSSAMAHLSQHSSSPAVATPASAADQLSVKEAKWHGEATLFTACANGRIFAYDLARIAAGGSALDCVHMREDSRQVNTLDINPHRPSLLLSGSQDGFVRYFDIRAPVQNRAGGMSYVAKAAFKCNADGVRQVRWSPREGLTLACATDAGAVLKWDIRKPNFPLMRITAHDKACSSISWHPDGNHLISGGWDHKCAVWDLSKDADKRQKPKYILHTPAPVSVIAWRPALWSASARGRRAAQVAVSYDDASSRRFGINAAHIWDLARPTVPFKELTLFDSPPSSLLWLDQDLLWAVGEEGKFHQCDVAFAPKVIDRLSPSSMAFSGKGEVAMFLDERPRQRPRPSIVRHHDEEARAVPRHLYGSSPTTPFLSISRSDSEDDVVNSFIGPRRRMGRRRRQSLRSVIPTLSTTPPSGHVPGEELVLGLEQAIKFAGVFRTQQAMAVGHVPAATKVDNYHYLTRCYLETLERELPQGSDGKPLVERVSLVLESFAQAAERVGQFRLAQTWRVLAYAMDLLLRRRAQYHLESRLGRFQKRLDLSKSKDSVVSSELKGPETTTPLSNPDPESHDTTRRPSVISVLVDGKPSSSLSRRSKLSEEVDSTSNTSTPVVTPLAEEGGEEKRNGSNLNGLRSNRGLAPVLESESFVLPPAVHRTFNDSPRKRLDSIPFSAVSHESDQTRISSTEGYDFYDTDAISHAIDVPEPKQGPKQGAAPLEFDHDPQRKRRPFSNQKAPNVARFDSDDSFSRVFSAPDGTPQTATTVLSPSRFSPVQEGDEEHDGEYESRIRGKEMGSALEHRRSPSPAAHGQQRRRSVIPTGSPDDVFIISQTTMASDPNTSFGASQPSQASQGTVDAYEDHAPLHVGVVPSTQAKAGPESQKQSQQRPQPQALQQLDVSPTMVESDYFPWPGDPPYPFPLSTETPPVPASLSPRLPLDPYNLVTRALDYELRTSVVNAAAMILLLKPLLPASLIDKHRATSILRTHHSRLTSMRLFVEATLLRNLCVKGWPQGLPDWGEPHTSIFGPAQQNVKGGLLCPTCRKPREIDPRQGPSALWQCDRCKTRMAPCAVCGHRETSAAAAAKKKRETGRAAGGDVEDVMSVWWYCPGCAHGGHATCIQAWHNPGGMDEKGIDDVGSSDSQGSGSDGCCPLDGCGHACLPGKWGEESTTQRADEVGWAALERARTAGGGTFTPRKMNGTGGGGGGEGVGYHAHQSHHPSPLIRGDGFEVPQSRAVESVREALAGNGGGGSSASSYGNGTGHPGGILSSSPGRTAAGGERERRKSVKFAHTER